MAHDHRRPAPARERMPVPPPAIASLRSHHQQQQQQQPSAPFSVTPEVDEVVRGIFSSEKREHRTVRRPADLRSMLQDVETFLSRPPRWQIDILRATNRALRTRFDVARFVLIDSASEAVEILTPDEDNEPSSVVPYGAAATQALRGHNLLFAALLRMHDGLLAKQTEQEGAPEDAAGAAALYSEAADAALELLSKLVSAGTTAQNVRELLQRSAHALVARDNKSQLRFLHAMDLAIRMSELDQLAPWADAIDQGLDADVAVALALRPGDRRPYALQAFEEGALRVAPAPSPRAGPEVPSRRATPSPDYAFFNFGGPGAGIRMDTLDAWPFAREYCMWIWIRIEEECGRCNLLKLRNANGHGISVELGGDDIIGYSITCVSSDARTSNSVRVGIPPDRLSSRTWHQITIHHYARLLGSSVLRVFVDNVEIKQTNGYSFSLPFPSRIKGPLCDAVAFENFDGQTGPLYLFREGLTLAAASSLMKMHLSRAKVGYSTAISAVAGSGLIASALERGLETRVYLAFDPIFVVRDLCLEVYGGRHGSLSYNSAVWNADNIRNLIGTVGGVPLLLPFLWKKLSDGSEEDDGEEAPLQVSRDGGDDSKGDEAHGSTEVKEDTDEADALALAASSDSKPHRKKTHEDDMEDGDKLGHYDGEVKTERGDQVEDEKDASFEPTGAGSAKRRKKKKKKKSKAEATQDQGEAQAEAREEPPGVPVDATLGQDNAREERNSSIPPIGEISSSQENGDAQDPSSEESKPRTPPAVSEEDTLAAGCCIIQIIGLLARTIRNHVNNQIVFLNLQGPNLIASALERLPHEVIASAASHRLLVSAFADDDGDEPTSNASDPKGTETVDLVPDEVAGAPLFAMIAALLRASAGFPTIVFEDAVPVDSSLNGTTISLAEPVTLRQSDHALDQQHLAAGAHASQPHAQPSAAATGVSMGRFKYNELEKALDVSLVFNLKIIARCSQADGSRSWTQVQWFDEAHARVAKAPHLFKQVLGIQTWVDSLRSVYKDVFFNNAIDVNLATTKDMLEFLGAQWVRIAAAMLCEEVTETDLHIVIAAAIGAGHATTNHLTPPLGVVEPDSPLLTSVIGLFSSAKADAQAGPRPPSKGAKSPPSAASTAGGSTWNLVNLYLARDAIRLLTVLLRSTPAPKLLFENCTKLDGKSGLASVLAFNVVASPQIGDDLRGLALRCITEFLIRVQYNVPQLEGFFAPSLRLLSAAASAGKATNAAAAGGLSIPSSGPAASAMALQQVPGGVKAFADAGGYGFLVHALASILAAAAPPPRKSNDPQSAASPPDAENQEQVEDVLNLNATYTALLEMMIASPIEDGEPASPSQRFMGIRHHNSIGSLGTPRRKQSAGSATWGGSGASAVSNTFRMHRVTSLAVDIEDAPDMVADLFTEQADLGPVLDDTQVISNPYALMVVLKLLPRLGLYLQQRICQDLFLLLKFQPVNRLYFCEVPGWQGSFLGLLGSLDNQGLTTSGAQVCFDLGVKLYVLVLQDVLVERVNGWEELETMMSLKPLLVRGDEITRSVLAQVMEGTLRELRADMPTDPVRITILWKSLRRLVLLLDMLAGLLPSDDAETITAVERLLDAVDLVTSISPHALLLDGESASRSVRGDVRALDLCREFCWPVDPRSQDELDKLRGPVAFAIISLSLNAMLHCAMGAPALRKHARRVTKICSFLRRIPRLKSLVRWPTLRGNKVKGEKSALVIKTLVDAFTIIRRIAESGSHEDGAVAHNLDYLLELVRTVSTTHSDLIALSCNDEFFVRKISSLNADGQHGPEWIFTSVITHSPFLVDAAEGSASVRAAGGEENADLAQETEHETDADDEGDVNDNEEEEEEEEIKGVPAALQALTEAREGITTFMQSRLRARWDEHGAYEMVLANTQARAKRESMALGFAQRLAFTESSRLSERGVAEAERERELVELWRQLTIEAAHEDSIWQIEAPERVRKSVQWMLSGREDRLRCRRLLCRNYLFDDHQDAIYHEAPRDMNTVSRAGGGGFDDDDDDDFALDELSSPDRDFRSGGPLSPDFHHLHQHAPQHLLDALEVASIGSRPGTPDGVLRGFRPRQRTGSDLGSISHASVDFRDEDDTLRWWRWLGGRYTGEPDLVWFEWLGGRVVGPPRPASWRRRRPSLRWQLGHGRGAFLSPPGTPQLASPLTPLGPVLVGNVPFSHHPHHHVGAAGARSPLHASRKVPTLPALRSPRNAGASFDAGALSPFGDARPASPRAGMVRPLSPMGSPLSPQAGAAGPHAAPLSPRGGGPAGFNLISTQAPTPPTPATPGMLSRASSPKTPRFPKSSLLNEVDDWAVRGWLSGRREHFSLRKGEQLVHVCSNAQWITPLEVTRGRLELSSEHLFFYANQPSQAQMNDEAAQGSSLGGKNGSSSSSSAAAQTPAWVNDLNILDPASDGDRDAASETSSKRRKRLQHQSKDMMRWKLAELTEVHGRRYLLRATALELFFSDMTNIFLCFPSAKARSDFFKAILRQPTPKLARTFKESLKPNIVFTRSGLMERWKRREISNFEYIMQLNTMAGRSYNDITQYPVFPWVLADYESETIDLEDPAVYRDLSKPIGALNEVRLRDFVERFETFCDASMDIPPFHYGSHYSNAGIVLHYLLRVEPFSTLAIDLQGGRFDCPDRLFFSIQDCWLSSMESMSDVKELIPEFFYCPEMFLNENDFPLGVRQDTGTPVDNVVLPPWAKGSAHEFVRIQREALESDYVSAHLHEWIDLIFGYKQLGEAAEDAHNVFYYLTYEGAVDLDAIVDPVLRHSIETQIAHFGQTPAQLLTQPHPARGKTSDGLALSRETMQKGGTLQVSRHAVWSEPANASTVMPASSPRSPGGAHGTSSASATASSAGALATIATEAASSPKPASSWGSFFRSVRTPRGSGAADAATAATAAATTVAQADSTTAEVNGGSIISGMSSSFNGSRAMSVSALATAAAAVSAGKLPRTPPVISLTAYADRLVAVYEDLSVAVHRISSKSWIPKAGHVRALSSAPLSLSAWARPCDRGLLQTSIGKDMRIGGETVVCAKQGKLVVSANFLDWSLRAQNVDNHRVDGAVVAHRGRVLCVTICEKEEVLVTGGQDCRVVVWRLGGAHDIRDEMMDLFGAPELATTGAASVGGGAGGIGGGGASGRPGAISIADGSKDREASSLGAAVPGIGAAAGASDGLLIAQGALLGHSTPVTAVAVSSGLSIVVSGSEHGQVLLHTLSDGAFVRTMQDPIHSSISRILIGRLTGNIVIHASGCASTRSVAVNGVPLAQTFDLENISALQVAYLEGFGTEVLLVGTTQGELSFFRFDSLQPLRETLSLGSNSSVRSIEIAPTQVAILVGTEDGQVVVVRAADPIELA